MFDVLMTTMVLLALVTALVAFATVAIEARRPVARLFAWTMFAVYSGVFMLAIGLVF